MPWTRGLQTRAVQVGRSHPRGRAGSCADSRGGGDPPAQARCRGSAPARAPESAPIGELPNQECLSVCKEQPILTRSFLLSSTIPVSGPGVARAGGGAEEVRAGGPCHGGGDRLSRNYRPVHLAGAQPWSFVLFCFAPFLSEVSFLFYRVLS